MCLSSLVITTSYNTLTFLLLYHKYVGSTQPTGYFDVYSICMAPLNLCGICDMKVRTHGCRTKPQYLMQWFYDQDSTWCLAIYCRLIPQSCVLVVVHYVWYQPLRISSCGVQHASPKILYHAKLHSICPSFEPPAWFLPEPLAGQYYYLPADLHCQQRKPVEKFTKHLNK